MESPKKVFVAVQALAIIAGQIVQTFAPETLVSFNGLKEAFGAILNFLCFLVDPTRSKENVNLPNRSTHLARPQLDSPQLHNNRDNNQEQR